jgi:hypothetical protein
MEPSSARAALPVGPTIAQRLSRLPQDGAAKPVGFWPSALSAKPPSGFPGIGLECRVRPSGHAERRDGKLNSAPVKALDDETTRTRLLELGSIIPDRPGRSPEALRALVEKEVACWTPILKAAGATVN